MALSRLCLTSDLPALALPWPFPHRVPFMLCGKHF